MRLNHSIDCRLTQGRYGAAFLTDKRILELGSGTGLVGLGLAFLGAKDITMTDLEGVVPLIQKNVDANPAIASRMINFPKALLLTRPRC